MHRFLVWNGWRILLASLIVYTCSYYTLVQPKQSILSMTGNGIPYVTKGDLHIITPPMRKDARYRWGDPYIEFLFVPANWLDRRLRPMTWTVYPPTLDGIQVWGLAIELQDHPKHEEWFRLLTQLELDRNKTTQDSSLYQEYTEQMRLVVAEMIAAAEDR